MTRARLIVSLLAASGCASPEQSADERDPYTPLPIPNFMETEPRGFDVTHYALWFRLAPDARSIEGTAELTIQVTTPINAILLDFGGYRIERVEVDGVEREWRRGAPYNLRDDQLSILHAIDVGEHTAKIVYAGRPLTRRATGSSDDAFTIGLHGFLDGGLDRIRFSQNQPDGARLWFPSVDHPSDKATLDMTIEVPTPLVAASNGAQLGEPEPLDVSGVPYRRYRFVENNEIATYLVAFAAGEMRVVRTMVGTLPVTNYFPIAFDAAEANARFAVLESALLALEDRFGVYPFERYGHVVIDSEEVIPGGLEHQTLTLVDGELFSETDPELIEGLLVHKLAHAWFGNLVTPANHRMYWFSEGMATIAEYLYLRQIDAPGGRFQRVLSGWIEGRREYWRRYLDDAILASLDDTEIIGPAPHFKGAAVLHMLRLQIGDAAFYRGMRLLLSRHAGGNVDNQDIRAAFEEESGTDLGLFFDQWIYDRGFPLLRYGCRARTSPLFVGAQVDCTFIQEQADYELLQQFWVDTIGGFPATPFRLFEMPLAVYLGYGQTSIFKIDDLKREVIFLEAKPRQTISFCVPELPTLMSIDEEVESYAEFISGLEPDDVPFICGQ
jgi:aminopeptidase N